MIKLYHLLTVNDSTFIFMHYNIETTLWITIKGQGNLSIKMMKTILTSYNFSYPKNTLDKARLINHILIEIQHFFLS